MKAQVIDISYVFAFFIFFLSLFATVFIAVDAIQPPEKEETLRRAATSAFTELQKKTRWTVHRAPIIVDTEHVLMSRNDITFAGENPYMENISFLQHISVQENSTALLSVKNFTFQDETVVDNASFVNTSTGRVFFTDVVRNGLLAYLTFRTEDTPTLTNRPLLTLVETDTTENEIMNWRETAGQKLGSTTTNMTAQTTSPVGFNNITLQGDRILNKTWALNDTATFDTVTTETRVWGDTKFDSPQTDFRVFGDSQIVNVSTVSETQTWELNLSQSFEKVFVNGTRCEPCNLSEETGTFINEETTNWVDFSENVSGGRGLGIISNDLTVSVHHNQTRPELTANITVNHPRAWLHFHSAQGLNRNTSFREVQPYARLFHEPYNVTVGVSTHRTGVSTQKFNDLKTRSYEEIRGELQLRGLEYNISLLGDSLGKPIPTNTEVIVVKRDVAVVDRYGFFTKAKATIAVWE